MKAIDKMVEFLEIFDQDVICAGGSSRGGFTEIIEEARRLAAEAKADEGIPAEICEGEDKLGVHLARPVGDKYMGLCMKYRVERLDGKPMPEGCIVLEWRDKNALSAIAEFSRSVRAAGYTPLANDLDKQLADKGYRPCADRTEELVKRLRELRDTISKLGYDDDTEDSLNRIIADLEKGARAQKGGR